MPKLSLCSVRAPVFLALTVLITVAAGQTQENSAPVFPDVTTVPHLIKYSGTLVDGRGYPVTAPVDVIFSLYARPGQAGEQESALWHERQQVQPEENGAYTVYLGAATQQGLPEVVFSAVTARYLGVRIEGEAELARTLLVSVPYALKAGDAQTLGGLPASAFVLAGQRNELSASDEAIKAATAANVTTTGGVAGYLPEFSGASSVIDSPLSVSGTNVGIGTIAPVTRLDVNGGVSVRGTLELQPVGNATSTAAMNSQSLLMAASAYNSSTKAATFPAFAWVAEATGNNSTAPSAALHLLSESGTATSLSETGMSINANGTINFAAGQKFPGTGTGNGTITGVTTGTGLTGGGTGGVVTLALNSAVVPELAAANTFTGANTFTASDTFKAGVNSIGDIRADFNGWNVGSVSPGLKFGSGNPGEAISSDRAGTVNPKGIDLYTDFLPRLSVTQSGSVGIGTTAPVSILDLSTTSKSALGPVLTLANPGGGGGASAAIVFNTESPSVPTYGATGFTSKIVAVNDGEYGDSLQFVSTYDVDSPLVPGHTSQNINMQIGSNGEVSIAGSLNVAGAMGSSGPFGNGSGSTGIVSTGGDFSLLDGNEPIYAESGGTGGVFLAGASNTAEPEGAGSDGGMFTGGDINANFSTVLSGDGIYAEPGGLPQSTGTLGNAATLNGNVSVSGTLSTPTTNSKIDHPLDPGNKYLVHSSIESSELINLYTGNVTTDELGLATVRLPDWFEAENTDFRYQLTVLGQFAQAIVKEKVAHGQFTIMTNATHVEVSWQITAVRQDAYAKAHPLVVEETKPGRERGFYMNPELFGQPREKQTEWARHPEAMRRTQTLRAAQRARAAAHNGRINTANQSSPIKAVNQPRLVK